MSRVSDATRFVISRNYVTSENSGFLCEHFRLFRKL
jgi:hypothetical protein